MAVTVERLEAEVNVDPSNAMAGLTALEAVIGAAARDRHARIDIDVDEEPLSRLGGHLDDIDRHVSRGRDGMSGFAGAVRQVGDAAGGAGGGIGIFTDGLGGMGTYANFGARGIAGLMLSVTAMGSAIVLVLGALSQFIVLLNVAVGAVLALAGALAPLLGLLAAAPAGILGIAGGLGAMVLGFNGIGAAVKAAEGAQTALTGSRRSGTAAARDMRAAERGLEQAVRGVTRAQENLKRAQEQVGEARKQAARNIRNLAHEAEEAVWAEEEAVMRLQEAQENLARAQNRTSRSGMTLTQQTDEFTGKVYEVAYASEEAVDSQDDLTQAQRAVIRAERELTRAKERTKDSQEASNEAAKKGVEGSDLVVQAIRRVEEAQRSLADAHYNVTDAQRRLAEQAKAASGALGGGSAAALKFRQAMAELTPEGRAFVNFLVNELKPAWEKVKDAAQSALLPPIQRGLEGVLAYMPRLEVHAANFAATVGGAVEEFLGLFTGENAARTDTLFEGANRDLGTMLDTANLIGDAILEVARVAEESGFTKWFTDAVSGFLSTMAEDVIAMAEDGRLAQWLGEVKTQAGLVWDFLSAVARMLGTVTEAGKPLGSQILRDLTAITNKWLAWMNTEEGQRTMKGWFDSIGDALEIIWPLIEDIIHEFFKFGEEGSSTMDDFKSIISDVRAMLPSITQILRNMSPIIRDVTTLMRPLIDFLAIITNALQNPWIRRIFGISPGAAIVMNALPVPGTPFEGGGGTRRPSTSTWTTGGKTTVTTTKIQKRASGGWAQEGMAYLVGERRPEIFVPQQSGRIQPRVMSQSFGNQTSLSPAQIESIVNRLADRVKPDVHIEQTYNEKVDPRLMSSELAWRLA